MNRNRKTIVIAGGSGFLGRAVAKFMHGAAGMSSCCRAARMSSSAARP